MLGAFGCTISGLLVLYASINQLIKFVVIFSAHWGSNLVELGKNVIFSPISRNLYIVELSVVCIPLFVR